VDLCGDAYVSVRGEQSGLAPYVELPLIIDESPEQGGPAGGLLAGWARYPECAWLVVATDLPFVDAPLLATLVRLRAPELLATAFRHPDGVPEPLCAIWEPRARAPLLERVRRGDRSLRPMLTAPATRAIDAEEPGRLRSVDRPADYESARRELERKDGPSGAL